MRVLITGANGFIGQHLAGYLSGRGHDVTALVRSETELPGSRIVRYDFENDPDSTQLDRILSGVDVVVHLLGLAHSSARATDKATAFSRVNVGYSKKLMQSAIRFGVSRFVYISSVKAFGEQSPNDESGRPIRISADQDDRPIDHYGQSKLAAEQALWELVAGTQTTLTILRLPLVYGPNQKGNMATLCAWLNRGYPLPFAAVKNLRSLVSVTTVCSAIAAVLETPNAQTGTYYLSDLEVSTPELVERIAGAYGRKARLVSIPPVFLSLIMGALGRKEAVDKLLGSLVVDSTPFEEDFGWRPTVEFADVMRQVAAANE